MSGSRADEQPISFLLDDSEVEIHFILKSWREPDYLYFRVETKEGGVYELRRHEYEDAWEMEEAARGIGYSDWHTQIA